MAVRQFSSNEAAMSAWRRAKIQKHAVQQAIDLLVAQAGDPIDDAADSRRSARIKESRNDAADIARECDWQPLDLQGIALDRCGLLISSTHCIPCTGTSEYVFPGVERVSVRAAHIIAYHGTARHGGKRHRACEGS